MMDQKKLEAIKNYLNQYRGQFPEESLKNKLLQSGYTQEEVNEATVSMAQPQDILNVPQQADVQAQPSYVGSGTTKLFNWKIYAIVAFILILIGVGGWYGYKYFTSKGLSQSNQRVSVKCPTGDWKDNSTRINTISDLKNCVKEYPSDSIGESQDIANYPFSFTFFKMNDNSDWIMGARDDYRAYYGENLASIQAQVSLYPNMGPNNLVRKVVGYNELFGSDKTESVYVSDSEHKDLVFNKVKDWLELKKTQMDNEYENFEVSKKAVGELERLGNNFIITLTKEVTTSAGDTRYYVEKTIIGYHYYHREGENEKMISTEYISLEVLADNLSADLYSKEKDSINNFAKFISESVKVSS